MKTGKISDMSRGEFTGWKLPEVLWMLAACGIIAATAVIMRDTPLSIAAALTGTLYTLLAGKGKRSCYLFGIVNSVCYAWMSFESSLYGEFMLYGGYYLPMMFAGLYAWNRNLDENATIIKTRLSGGKRVWLVLWCGLGIAAYGFLLWQLNGRTPGLDSATNVLSVAAMILTVKRCIEQWYLWFAVNTLSIVMWAMVWYETGEASAIVAMYAVWLICSVIFYFSWCRDMAPQSRDGAFS